jgi:ribosomal protein S18 acetylase RimI-like enzyme
MPHLRPARPDEAPTRAAIAAAAYARYLPRMQKPPGPMLADYDQVLATSEVWLAEDEDGGQPVGFAVLAEHPDHLLLDNVAVHPDHQGRGIGRTLLDHAETIARNRHLPRVRLYTHETMTENLALYRARGYIETARRTEHGYRRVHLTKTITAADGDPATD